MQYKQEAMFGLFKKTTAREKLNKKYDLLMEESYKLSRINRKASDEKYAEAQAILKEMENMKAD